MGRAIAINRGGELSDALPAEVKEIPDSLQGPPVRHAQGRHGVFTLELGQSNSLLGPQYISYGPPCLRVLLQEG